MFPVLGLYDDVVCLFILMGLYTVPLSAAGCRHHKESDHRQCATWLTAWKIYSQSSEMKEG